MFSCCVPRADDDEYLDTDVPLKARDAAAERAEADEVAQAFSVPNVMTLGEEAKDEYQSAAAEAAPAPAEATVEEAPVEAPVEAEAPSAVEEPAADTPKEAAPPAEEVVPEDVVRFIQQLRNEGVVLMKHDRAGHTRERVFNMVQEEDGVRVLEWKEPGALRRRGSSRGSFSGVFVSRDRSIPLSEFTAVKETADGVTLIFTSREMDLRIGNNDNLRTVAGGFGRILALYGSSTEEV